MATNYGKDVFCTDSRRVGRLVTGPLLVGQALYRRLTTPPGTLLPVFGDADDAAYGLDISAEVGKDPKNAEASLPGKIRAEGLKDERISAIKVGIVKTVSGPATSFAITVEAELIEGETFRLVMSATAARTALVGITAEAA